MKGLYFLIGVVVGAGAATLICKKYYDSKLEEEIDSVKEAFKTYDNKEEPEEEFKEPVQEVTPSLKTDSPEIKDLKDYANILRKSGYKGPEKKSSIYTIAPDEFGEDEENYETVSLTYYADGVLCDENDEVMEEPEQYIGDALNKFGEWEPDAAYVRNEYLHIEYEILKDERPFSEVSENIPKPVRIKHGDDDE